ncbi:hypothetical protein C5F63_00485 [Photobacterium damselae subsp. damselae]|nr:hypothetical protein C5F62_19435 [Photobacterium damselae subsp. damselae]PSB90812.1 hypothetical protein C5F63_00485 [Photobacterium damselae subsp. damselae]
MMHIATINAITATHSCNAQISRIGLAALTNNSDVAIHELSCAYLSNSSGAILSNVHAINVQKHLELSVRIASVYFDTAPSLSNIFKITGVKSFRNIVT